MFIRTKCAWKQMYFSLVEAYCDKEGRPRQHAVHLGTTLNLSVEEWIVKILKAEATAMFRGDIERAVRAYCKKHGLPLKTADAVRAAQKLVQEKEDAEEAENLKKLLESHQRWQRQNPEGARRASAFRHSASSDRFQTLSGFWVSLPKPQCKK